jgi:hypothetical protein
MILEFGLIPVLTCSRGSRVFVAAERMAASRKDESAQVLRAAGLHRALDTSKRYPGER